MFLTRAAMLQASLALLSSLVCLSVCPSVTDVLWLNGKSQGSAMVPSDRALATSYKLSIVFMSPSAAVWPQFSMESFKL